MPVLVTSTFSSNPIMPRPDDGAVTLIPGGAKFQRLAPRGQFCRHLFLRLSDGERRMNFFIQFFGRANCGSNARGFGRGLAPAQGRDEFFCRDEARRVACVREYLLQISPGFIARGAPGVGCRDSLGGCFIPSIAASRPRRPRAPKSTPTAVRYANGLQLVNPTAALLASPNESPRP